MEQTILVNYTDFKITIMESMIRFEYDKGVRFIYPAHPMVRNWRFEDGAGFVMLNISWL